MLDDMPGLGVGFTIDTGGSVEALELLANVMDSTEGKVLQQAAAIERATSGMVSTQAATAAVQVFGAESSRSLETVRQSTARLVSQGEGLVRNLERQNAAFGLSRDQVRAMKAETLALALVEAGRSELAERIRAEEQALYDKQFAAMRREKAEQDELIEAKIRATQAAEVEAKAIRDAATAHAMFEARARQGLAAMKAQEAAVAADAVALARLRAMLDPAAAAQERLGRETAEAERLMLAAGHSTADVARVQTLLADSYNHSAVAGRKMGYALTQLSFQANDVVTMFAMGAPPMQVFVSQAGQIAQVAQMAEGGLKGLARAAVAAVAPFAAIAAVVGIAAIGVAAWVSYSNALEKLNGVAAGTGRLIDATGSELEALAESTARAAGITVGSARQIVTAYAETGRIGLDVLPGLAIATENFARATSQSADEASKQLASAFADPAKGAEELTVKYGLLDAAALAYIDDLAQQGRQTEAQIALLKGLEGAFDGAASHGNILARAWRSISTAASDAWVNMGKAIDLALGGGSTLEKLTQAKEERSMLLASKGGAGAAAGLNAKIAGLERQLAEERRSSSNAAARSASVAGMKVVDSITGKDQLGDLQGQLGKVNSLLTDNGRAAGLSASQLSDARAAQEALTHAVETFLSPAEKAQKIAALDARIAAARGSAAKAALVAERERVELAGQVITSAAAQAQAQSKAAVAAAQAGKSVTTHAATLVRDAEASRAQTANLYALAAAYGVSDAAALIAEARVKAESQAIKQRGDVEAAVNRQIQLVIAQRIADGAKSTAATRAQARAQGEINSMVAAGIVPAERANELLRDRMADLPLLTALEAAKQRGTADDVKAATKALDEQRAARERLAAVEAQARINAGQQEAADRLEILRAELRLIGATDAARVHALATLKAWQEAQAKGFLVDDAFHYVAAQVAIADQAEANRAATNNFNDSLRAQADLLDAIDANAQNAARGMADAFGSAGSALGDLVTAMTGYAAWEERLAVEKAERVRAAGNDAKRLAEIEQLYATKAATAQIGLVGDMASSAQGFFREGSDGYKALGKAVQIFRAIEFALSVRAMVQDAAETVASIANSGARTAVKAVEAVVSSIAGLPFPFNLAAGAATIAALASIGVGIAGAFGGGGGSKPVYNAGAGTVFGDGDAKSDSLKRSIDILADLDTETLVFTRQMAASLKAIESNISGLTNLVIRLGGDEGIGSNAAAGVKTGFDSALPGIYTNGTLSAAAVGMLVGGPIGAAIGVALTKVPIIGDILGGITKIIGGLFGTKRKITASGIFGAPQSLADIDSLGFAGQSFADIKKTKKFFGLSTGSKYSTQFGELDDALEDQFGKLLLSFADAIKLSAGPLGLSLGDVEAKLSAFIVDIGKIDLKGLSGEEIQEKLTAVFGAQADKMAQFVLGGLEKFQGVGEGYFETLVRVASTVETVTNSLERLGLASQSLGIDASMAIADLFGGAKEYASAAGAYFTTFYSEAEQAAAKTAQLGKVFASLGLSMPDSIASFRALVEAQDLTSAAGQRLYASLLQIAPAFAEIVSAGQSAASAAAILRERQDLEKQLMQIQGRTAEIRAAELSQLDPSNRALQNRIWALQDEAAAAQAAAQVAQERAGLEQQLLNLQGDTAELRRREIAALDPANRALQRQIYALQDAQAAAQKAKQLADAWRSIGDTIADEIARIRGLTATPGQGYATLLAQFDAANTAARGGDQAAAKSLPELSKALLDAAAAAATSRQELDRIEAATAAKLEQTYGLIAAITGASNTASSAISGSTASTPDSAAWWAAFAASQGAPSPSANPANDVATEIRALRAEVAQLRQDNNRGHERTGDAAGKVAKTLDTVTRESGGTSISVEVAA